MVQNKTTNEAVISQVSKVLDQKLAPLSRKFPELIPKESQTNVHTLVKNLFTGKIPNLQLPGRLAHFSKNWKQLTQDQEYNPMRPSSSSPQWLCGDMPAMDGQLYIYTNIYRQTDR